MSYLCNIENVLRIFFYFFGNYIFIFLLEVNILAEKHLILTGISNISWKDAIVQTINEASKTLDYISSIKILEQTAKIDGNKIIEYYATIELKFMIDSNR